MPTWNPRANDLFLKALEMRSVRERQEYLDGACVGDAALRAEVESLLEASARAGSFLEYPVAAPGAAVDLPPLSETPGTVIGPYKLLEQIGEGGMGIVYMAEQVQPVRRKVALKIIKPGMDTRHVIARFEAERQALAMMDHPNIAKVLDAGATESGRPYFVMELVRGIPITEYCDQHRLPINERLDLFKQVCQAVQHAHQKGIIHRDIKPTNVLVTALDGVPLPRVIDFGIAKATGQSLTNKTLFTGFAQLIGTPLYMSPEQAELSAVDIDTKSDIYSLGVLLYELLTGTTPFDQDTFRTAALDEVRRIIREDEPPKPSTRLSGLGATLTAVSDNRQTDARKLNRSLRGELDWIVMKALEKDRRRRYETASGLARDVERYMAGDPVEAGPPSGWYRLRKFARRNRVVLTATVLVALALIAGTTVSAWQAILARRARANALAQRDLAQRQQQRAEIHLRQAREAVDQMLTEVGQETLSRVPHMEPVRRALLEKALGFYEKFLVQEGDDPAVRREAGRAYRRVGDIRRLLNENERATEAYSSSIDLLCQLAASRPSDLDCRRELAESRVASAQLNFKTGKTKEAEREYREAMKLRSDILERSSDNPDDRLAWAKAQGFLGTLFLQTDRLGQAKETFGPVRIVLERLVVDFPNEPRYQSFLGAFLNDLASVAFSQDDSAEARSLYQQAATHQHVALSVDPQNVRYRVFARNHQENLAMVLSRLGQRSDAERIVSRCISIGEALRSDFPLVPQYREDLAGTYGNLGLLLNEIGPERGEEAARNFDKAAVLFQALVAEYPGVPGYRHGLAASRNALGQFFRATRRWKEAEQSYRAAVELGEGLVTAEPNNAYPKPFLAEYQENLARLLTSDPGAPFYDPQQALKLAQEAIKLTPEKGPRWTTLALAQYRVGDWKASRTAIEEATQRKDGKLDPMDQFVLAMARWRLGEKDGARTSFNWAAAEMAKKKSQDEATLRLRAEAAGLIGPTGATAPEDKEKYHPK